VDVRERVGVEVRDGHGAGGGAVALPNLPRVRAVDWREEHGATHVRQVEGRVVVVAGNGVDVLEQGGAGSRAVAPPQLPPVRAVVGREEQRPVHVRELLRVRAVRYIPPVSVDVELRVRSRIDVLDEGGAGGGAVALPQLPPVRAVVGREEQRPVHVREGGGVRAGGAGVDVLYKDDAGGGAAAPPQPPAVGVAGLEEQRPVHVAYVG